jgi:hypothetical protein
MDPVRWLGLIRNVMVGREGLDRSVLLDLAARAGRRELVAQRPVPWLQELESVDRFTGYDPDEWVFEVAFVRHDAPALDISLLDDPKRTVIVEARAGEVLAARPRTGGARPHVNRLLEAATGRPATSRGWSTLQRVAHRL